MAVPKVSVFPIPPKMLIVLSKNMIGFAGFEIVVFVKGDIPAIFMDGPGMRVPAVTDIIGPRVKIAEVAPHIFGRRHPVVKRLMERCGIEPKTLRGNKSLVFWQADVNPPLRAGGKVHRPNDAADAAIGILLVEVIDRAGCSGRMADQAKIEFDPPRGPRPPHGNISELDHLVKIDKFLLGRFFYGPPELAPNLREYPEFDVGILEDNCFPLLFASGCAVPIKTKIGVDPSNIGHGTGIIKGIGFHQTVFFFCRGLLGQ